MTTIVPRNIFQTWKPKEISNPILKAWQASWKLHNPTYTYELWDDNDNRQFVVEHFPDFLQVYDSYDKMIKRADAIRYLYLYKFGGVYADLDFECIRSFEPILQFLDNQNIDICLGTIDTSKAASKNYDAHSVPNAIMISKRGAHFWSFVIGAMIKQRVFNLPPELQTGPVFLNMCISAYAGVRPQIPAVITGLQPISEAVSRSDGSPAVISGLQPLSESIFGADIFTDAPEKPTSTFFLAEQHTFYPINWCDASSHIKYTERLYTQDELRAEFPKSFAVTYWMHSW